MSAPTESQSLATGTTLTEQDLLISDPEQQISAQIPMPLRSQISKKSFSWLRDRVPSLLHDKEKSLTKGRKDKGEKITGEHKPLW